ncbi:hypothetical protein [Shinella kummerowiae]|jgi:hypothetical protein|uniref:Uncharacterized protein n=1 Tax=Shinella kummerowiae TaxID=417745 RepID=A0A6N8SHK7_9HYPH|nr:hypothetical protein [Shinella kummerowiae]MCT7664070.1 hypothetical protein [Shinella kummerowiae]MXN48564.1 hypothetical protein [Shinella kummerowiae]
MYDRTQHLLFLLVETALFVAASLVHAGILVSGFEHARAMVAEGVIGAVLAVGVLACLIRPGHAAVVALSVQFFALLGTLVGAFTISVGVGPQTRGDIAFHALLLLVLPAGIFAAWKAWRQRRAG